MCAFYIKGFYFFIQKFSFLNIKSLKNLLRVTIATQSSIGLTSTFTFSFLFSRLLFLHKEITKKKHKKIIIVKLFLNINFLSRYLDIQSWNTSLHEIGIIFVMITQIFLYFKN